MLPDSRDEALARLTHQLDHAYHVRLRMIGIVTLAWLAGFLTSFALLHLGVTTMAVRYAVATLLGYGVFVLTVRLWLTGGGPASNVRDDGRHTPSVNLGGLGRIGGEAAKGGDALFKGGRSGGAGASALWDANTPAIQPVLMPPPATPLGSAGGSGSKGFGGLGKVKGKNAGAVIAVALIIIALLVVGGVVWSAPHLIAEMLVDGAIAGGALRGAARAHRRQVDVVRHTWIPALIVFVLMVAMGVAGQSFKPDALSIGDLFR